MVDSLLSVLLRPSSHYNALDGYYPWVEDMKKRKHVSVLHYQAEDAVAGHVKDLCELLGSDAKKLVSIACRTSHTHVVISFVCTEYR